MSPFVTCKTSSLLPVVAVLLLGSACKDDEPAKVPTLRSFMALGADMSWELLESPDASSAMVPPRVTFKAIFDARLDGSRLENADAGTGRPGLITASAVVTPGAAAIQVPMETSYNPAGVFMAGPGPSLAAMPGPSLPSGSYVTIALNPAAIVGKDGQPFVGPKAVAVSTLPFEVTAMYLEPEIPPGYTIPISFSNFPDAHVTDAIVVTDATGAAVDIITAPDMDDPATFTIEYARPGGWPLGTYTLTIAATAADVFGVPLAAGAFVKAFVVVPEPDAEESPDAGADDAQDSDI